MAWKINLQQPQKSKAAVQMALGVPQIEKKEHNVLIERDAQDCHPIGAITDLQETLDEIPMREFTALEISKIIF